MIVSVLKLQFSTEFVAFGVVVPLQTTATPVEPIVPLTVPPDTVKVLPVIVSVYEPFARPVPETLTLEEVELPQFTRTTPSVPLATYAMLPLLPSFSDLPTERLWNLLTSETAVDLYMLFVEA